MALECPQYINLINQILPSIDNLVKNGEIWLLILRSNLLKYHIIWPSGFRGKAVLEIDQQETRLACGSHIC
jgi:hypothetical protein